MKNPNMPIAPIIDESGMLLYSLPKEPATIGLTKREEFTKVAMQQLIPKYMHLPATDRWQLVANEAINCAEAVLAELKRRKPKC